MNLPQFHNSLWLLLLMPLLAALIWSIRRGRRTAAIYSDVTLLKTLPTTTWTRLKRILPWLKFAGLALAIAALARPQYGSEEFRIRTEGIAIAMCIDRSGSMEAMDFFLDGKRVDRLTAVKKTFHDFVAGTRDLEGRANDLVGLVAFGGFVDAECPLTLDHDALLEVLANVQVPQAVYNTRSGQVINEEEMATAIGDAVAVSVDRLRKVKAKSKVLILLSDGEHNAGVIGPDEAAEAAKSLGVKIYTIGIGRSGEAPFPVKDRFNKTHFISQWVELDEETLKMLAEQTGGKYFHASNTKVLEHVYADIDQLEKSETEGRLYAKYDEWYRPFLGTGLTLVLLTLLLSTTVLRSLP